MGGMKRKCGVKKEERDGLDKEKLVESISGESGRASRCHLHMINFALKIWKTIVRNDLGREIMTSILGQMNLQKSR